MCIRDREGCWLSKDGDTVKVNSEGTCLLRVPLHNVEVIVTLGWDIGVSPYLMGAWAERGITLSFCNPYVKFLAGVQGFMKGNILLRREMCIRDRCFHFSSKCCDRAECFFPAWAMFLTVFAGTAA